MITPVDNQTVMLQTMSRLQQVASNEQMAVANDSPITNDFTQVIRAINQQQNVSAAMQTAVETGRSDDLVGTMIASQKAGLSFSMLMQVRNKVINAVDDVMRMSL